MVKQYTPSMPKDRQIVSELRNYYTENDDIEPLSRNKFLFAYGLKSGNYGQKKADKPIFQPICPLLLLKQDLNLRPSD